MKANAETQHTIGRLETVLLVEDDVKLRSVLSQGLGRLGYKVLLAEDGREAIATAEQSAVDALVTDLSMPSMNGRELARTLRARLPGLRVLFISGHGPDADPSEAFLQKPFRLRELASKLRTVLDSGEQRGHTDN